MNFFKSILSDDPDPLPNPDEIHNSQPNPPHNAAPRETYDDENGSDETADAHSNPRSSSSADGSGIGTSSTAADNVGVAGWSFSVLIKTITTRSESVIENYRRDLQEFGSGLKKETELFREVASQAVKDLPASIEVGASVAHGSLESVGHAIDGVIKSTAGIISQSKETTAISHSDVDSDTPDTSKISGSGRYNRFDTQLNAIQGDMSTFTEDPEDVEDYENWKLGFLLEEKGDEIEKLIGEHGVLEDVYAKVIPNVVDIDSFWCRYFYRVQKLKQQESVRANLVKRAISTDDDEELSWDVDDDDDNLQENDKSKGDELDNRTLSVAKPESTSYEPQSSSLPAVNDSGEINSTVNHVAKADKAVQLGEMSLPEDKTNIEENSQVKNEEKVVEDEELPFLDAKGDQGESGKDSGVSIVSSQKSVHEEQDLEWDEIEDIGSGDEKKAKRITQGDSPNRADVRKRLSTAEEDEELSWDIEDED